MKQIIRFSSLKGIGKFKSSQVTTQGDVKSVEAAAMSLVGVYPKLLKNRREFTMDMFVPGEEDFHLNENLQSEQLPAIELTMDSLFPIERSAPVSSIIGHLVMKVIYEHATITLSREDNNPLLKFTLKCFDYEGEAEIFVKPYEPLPNNLAGGIITSSFIGDGSAVRTREDLQKDLSR